ncbi:MAG TPA: DUF5010 domain-containing protein [Polyangiaceae bacterium]|nr:DUF5010 domain-containing protein [Polyangiaceae bacterium]
MRALLLLGLLGTSACDARTTSVGSYQPAITQGHSVQASEITLQSVTAFGHIPVFGALTGYATDEASAAAATQAPLYAPYDSADPGWWDNLVAEQNQARVRRVLFPTRGVGSLDAADLSGPGDLNPRRLSSWVDAVARAGSMGSFEAGCYVDTPFLQQIAASLHGAPATTALDLAQKNDWNDVVWLRAIKPWFDTIPASYWWTQDDDTPGGRGAAVIQFGPLDATLFANASGNASQMLSFIAAQFQTAYGSALVFVLDSSWFTVDPSVAMLTTVMGNSPDFAAPSTPNAFLRYQGRSFGTAVPGFTDPSYESSTSPNYHSASVLIPRKINAADGSSALTLEGGLSAASSTASITLLQSFTDYADSAGLYRSAAWDFPNQDLNLIRRYGDLRTVTLRLEAEGCDRFQDTTTGNSSGAFRRTGDLDVRALASRSGWAVTDTAPGEWLEFDDVDFSAGNYEFIANYATTDGDRTNTPSSKLLQLAVDGTKLPPALVPGSANAEDFSAYFLGQATLSHGPHTLRLTFLDGQVDLDWLFLKKTDPLGSLQTSAGTFVSAIGGGNDVLQGRIARASIYENFSFDDLNGGSLTDGDVVNLQAYDGYYLTVDATSGMLSTTARAPDSGAVFTVKSLAGHGDITDGQMIALVTADGAHYLTVGTDMNQTLDVSGTSIGAAQTFVLGLSPQ